MNSETFRRLLAMSEDEHRAEIRALIRGHRHFVLKDRQAGRTAYYEATKHLPPIPVGAWRVFWVGPHLAMMRRVFTLDLWRRMRP